MSADLPAAVNAHYLDHVVAAGQASAHALAASEDIVSGNGIKLIAEGTPIDAGLRGRLLEHKLRKPLEDCLQIEGDTLLDQLEPLAEALLEKHALVRALCASAQARGVPASLGALSLSPQLRSLLTVYAQSQEGRLEHTVGVSMLALGLARRLQPGDVDRHRMLAIAGLVHDIGELYIDPSYLVKGTRLAAEQWRHVVTHPLVAHRVLRDMAGAGKPIADAVLQHHERMDGFGYPNGVTGAAFSLDGQIIAAAEWLMAIVEADSSPITRARMADRLVPGEFSPALLGAVSAAAREAPDEPVELAAVPPLRDAVPRIVRLAGTLQRLSESRELIDERIAGAQPLLKEALEAGLQRALRIQASFASTGLDIHNAQQLLDDLAALNDPTVYAEITTLVGELEWRMRELERNQRLRASQMPTEDGAVIGALIDRVRGAAPVGAGEGNRTPV